MSTFQDVRARFSAAMVTEGKNIDFKKNKAFIRIKENNPEIQQFINSLPNGLPRNAFVNSVDKLNDKETAELIKIFKSKDGSNLEKELNDIDHTKGIGKILFDMKNTGIGKGEILIAWVFKNATINGGSQSFDVLLNGKKYEVKDLGDSPAVKVGTEGMVTQFEFHKEFVDTLRRMDKLTRDGKIDINSNILTDDERRVWKALSDKYESDSIMSGEVGKNRVQLLKNFYQVFSQSRVDDISGFTNLILRGPYTKPIELSINPTELENVKPGDQITLTVSDSKLDRTYLMTELRRLKYVREPDAVDGDIQAAVDTLTADQKLFIFFSNKKGVIITNKLKSESFTQSRLIVRPA